MVLFYEDSNGERMKIIGKTIDEKGNLIPVYECEKCKARIMFPKEECWGCKIRRDLFNYQEAQENNLI